MLKLDYGLLAQASKDLQKEGSDFETSIGTIGKIIKGLPEIWEAETCDKYVEQYVDAEKTLKEVRQLIADMAEQMDKIAKNFADADTTMTGQM